MLFPNVRQYLAAEPIEVNGSAPLIPPSGPQASASAAPSSPGKRALLLRRLLDRKNAMRR